MVESGIDHGWTKHGYYFTWPWLTIVTSGSPCQPWSSDVMTMADQSMVEHGRHMVVHGQVTIVDHRWTICVWTWLTMLANISSLSKWNCPQKMGITTIEICSLGPHFIYYFLTRGEPNQNFQIMPTQKFVLEKSINFHFDEINFSTPFVWKRFCMDVNPW